METSVVRADGPRGLQQIELTCIWTTAGGWLMILREHLETNLPVADFSAYYRKKEVCVVKYGPYYNCAL